MLVEKLQKIKGMKQITIDKLLSNGLKNISSLKTEKYFNMLSIESQAHILHPPISKIPKSLIEKIDKMLFSNIFRNYTIAGSYRRELPYSGDIDVLTTDKLSIVKSKLEKYKPFVYYDGDEKLALIITIFGKNIKCDIMHCSQIEYPYFLLYLTGSKALNIIMRSKAKNMGLVLNQHGLFKDNKLLYVKTEQDIFKLLNMEYKAPKERSLLFYNKK